MLHKARSVPLLSTSKEPRGCVVAPLPGGHKSFLGWGRGGQVDFSVPQASSSFPKIFYKMMVADREHLGLMIMAPFIQGPALG